MADKSFRVLLDVTDLYLENFKYVWINVSPRELKTISEFKKYVLRKIKLEQDVQLFVRDGLLLEEETVAVLREDDTVKIKYKAPVCQNIPKEPLKESANSSRKRNFSESNVSDEDGNSKRYKPGVITLSSNGNEEYFVEKKFRKEKRKKQIEPPIDSDSIYITAVEKKKKQTESPINSDSIYITAVEKKKKQTESPINSDSIYITAVEKRKKEKELPLDPENVCSTSVEKRKKEKELLLNSENVCSTSVEKRKKEKELLLNSENVCSTSVEKRKKEKKMSLTSENVYSTSVEKGKKQTESSVNFENSHSILSEESHKKSLKMNKKKSSIACDRTVTGINFCISDSFYSFNAECTPQKQNKNYKSSKTAHLKSEEVSLVTLNNGSSSKEELNYHQNESSKVITDINYEALNSKNESKPKRKRRRKRKNNPATSVTDGSEVTNVSKSFSDVEENINRKHIMYLSPDKIQENNCSNDASEFLNPSTETFVLKEDKFANIRALDYPKMSTPTQSNNCGVPDWQLSIMPSKNSSLVKYVESNENGSILLNKSTRSTASQSHRESKSEKQSYEHLPDITSLPIVGTYVAYKTLELNENYSPSVTDYREGVVERINPDTEELEIRLMKEIILPGRCGKFENLGKDDVPEDIVKSYDVLKWCDIISPKLLSCVPD